MKAVVRPELPTASVGSPQAPTAAVDNSAPRLTTPESTYKSGKSVQTTGATSIAGNPVDGVKRVACPSLSRFSEIAFNVVLDNVRGWAVLDFDRR